MLSNKMPLAYIWFVSLFAVLLTSFVAFSYAQQSDENVFVYESADTTVCDDQTGMLTVGPGGDFSTIDEAFKKTNAGDKIALQPIVYTHGGSQRINLLVHDLTICGNGAVIEPAGNNVAKGLITTILNDGKTGRRSEFDLYIADVTFRNAKNTDRNGAGIRIQGNQSVTCVRCRFIENQNGILGGTETGVLYLVDSVFEANGSDGFSHGIYFNALGGTLIVEGSRFTDTLRGMHVKSLASKTIVKDSFFDDWTSKYSGNNANRASRIVEVTGGGDVLVEGNTMFKDPQAENIDVIFYAITRGGEGGKVLVKDNTITVTHPQGRILRNNVDSVATFIGNDITSIRPYSFGSGLIEIGTGNVWNGSAAQPQAYLQYMKEFQNAIVGSKQDDILVGTRKNDVIVGSGGDDRLYGDRGSDSLYGEEGNDLIYSGHSGGEFLAGGLGNDVIVIDSGGSKFIVAGPGDDTILLMFGKSIVSCGEGIDTVVAPGLLSEVLAHRPDGVRWLLRPKAGFPNNLLFCEKIQFEDGIFDIATQSFTANILPVTVSDYYPVVYPNSSSPIPDEGEEVVTIPPLVVSSINVTGPFSYTSSCSKLQVTETCNLFVSFTPTVSGVQTGELVIRHSESSQPVRITLSGVGTTADPDESEDVSDEEQEQGEVSEKPSPPADLPVELSRGLVGHWNFDTVSKDRVLDVSGLSRNGTIRGIIESVPGVSGNALRFDRAEDSVLFGNSSDFAFGTNDFSTCVWISSEESQWYNIVSHSAYRDNGWNFGKASGGNGLWFRLYKKDSANSDGFRGARKQISSDGTWQHLCFTADRDGDVTFYKDGNVVDTLDISEFSSRTVTNRGRLCLGCESGTFAGFADELRVYDRLLHSNEVKELYNQHKNGASSPPVFSSSVGDIPSDFSQGLVGHWTFNDISGNSVPDSSGRNNTGTIIGSVKAVSGVSGGALEFSGSNSRVSFGNASTFDFGTSNFSVCTWISTTQNSWFDIIRDVANRDNGWSLGKASGHSGLWFRIHQPKRSDTQAFQGARREISSDGIWQHLCFTADRESFVTFYKNGKSVSAPNISSASSLSVSGSRGELCIGCGARGFEGKMDELRIYNRLLTDAEVQGIYNQHKNSISLLSSSLLAAVTTVFENILNLFKSTLTRISDLSEKDANSAAAIVSIDQSTISFGEQRVGTQSISRKVAISYLDESLVVREVSSRSQDRSLASSDNKIVLKNTMGLGARGEEVTILQKYLTSDPALYPEGIISGFYGTLTQRAVERFQIRHNIVSSGSPETTGFGLVGPKTLKVLNQLLSI